MRFTNRELAGIGDGKITVVFRRWNGRRVNVGTKLRSPVGLVEVIAVTDVADSSDLSDDDMAAGGFGDRNEMLSWADGAPGRLFRIQVRPAGPDPRVALRQDDRLDQDQIDEISRRLARMDRAASEPWTRRTLRLIADNPERVSTELAAEMDLPRDYFKRRVRRLKELGLTESREVGYRLSPRGAAFLHSLSGSTEGE
ncbi:MAG TPA: hypothetical protein VHL52_11935 [Acidimicrobiia bacterium]|nr:hypothetical protein [Acidimicrobiia bacterium]